MSGNFVEEFEAAKVGAAKDKIKIGIAAVVLGIVGIFWLSLPLGLIAAFGGRFGLDKHPTSKMLGIAGIVLGVLDIVLFLIKSISLI